METGIRVKVFLTATAILLGACSPSPSTPTESAPTQPDLPTSTSPPTATPWVTSTPLPEDDQGHPGLPLPSDEGRWFTASGGCVSCHNNLENDTGGTVSLGEQWRATILANSARDPYWQATVQREVSAYPDLAETIESLCVKCHMPMASVNLMVDDETVQILGEGGLVDPENDNHHFAMDGISCALCHQLRPPGEADGPTYNGAYTLDTFLQRPERPIYGPFTIDQLQTTIMTSASGYVPVQGLHVSNAEFCATCHVLYTPVVSGGGIGEDEFPEQMTYLEFYYSDYRNLTTCQACHMPDSGAGVRLSTTSDVFRSPFSNHTFVGSNVYVLRLLQAFPEELAVTASGGLFQDAIDNNTTYMAEEAATIEIEDAYLLGRQLTADVLVTNLAGHKFPTGFPSRRTWLHFVVQDANGQVVFESGGFNPDGSIIGNANDDDPSLFEPHYRAIVQEDQVQIYEAIIGTAELQVTTDLLQAARYIKDNRLLPDGFEKAAPYEDIAVRGEAREDENFLGGTDRIQYIVTLPEGSGPYTVTIELLYQSIGYRWAQDLREYSGSEIDRFLRYYDAIPNTPVVVASATIEVAP
jgi:hypothetical protein